MRNFVILGAGGIGSNVKMVLSKTFDGKIITIDDDIVEASNLNRSDFFVRGIGGLKADRNYRISTREEFFEKSKDFLKDIIEAEGGSMSNVTLETEVFNEEVWKRLRESLYVTVIDCRDTIDPKCIFPEIDFKLTYNGAYGARMEVNPFHSNDSVFGTELEAVRYGTTPSFCLPPIWLSVHLARHIRMDTHYTNKETHSIEVFNIEEKITSLIKEVEDV